jgi:hypothetical protein
LFPSQVIVPTLVPGVKVKFGSPGGKTRTKARETVKILRVEPTGTQAIAMQDFPGQAAIECEAWKSIGFG